MHLTTCTNFLLGTKVRLGKKKKKTLSFFSVMRSVFVGSFKCVCIGCGQTLCTYIKLTFHLHHARPAVQSLLHSCVVLLWNLPSIFTMQSPSWLWLVWSELPVFTHQGMVELTSQHNGTNNALTPPYPIRIGSIVDTHVKSVNTWTLPYARCWLY